MLASCQHAAVVVPCLAGRPHGTLVPMLMSRADLQVLSPTMPYTQRLSHGMPGCPGSPAAHLEDRLEVLAEVAQQRRGRVLAAAQVEAAAVRNTQQLQVGVRVPPVRQRAWPLRVLRTPCRRAFREPCMECVNA